MAVSPYCTIGSAERLTGLTARQIRYFEDKGLVSPKRSPGNHRLYSPRDIEDLRRIKAWRDRGLDLAAISRVLAASRRERGQYDDVKIYFRRRK